MSDEKKTQTQFREGDIVRWSGCDARPNDPITGLVTLDGVLFVAWSDGGPPMRLAAYRDGDLTILRRQVRTGDVLLSPRMNRMTVTGVDPHGAIQYIVEDDPTIRYATGAEVSLCQYPNGASIEPPQKRAEAPQVANAVAAQQQNALGLLASRQYGMTHQIAQTAVDAWMGHVGNNEEALRGQQSASSGRALASLYESQTTERAADSVPGERFRQEQARANRLADELQPLRDERDRLQRRCDALELQMRRAGIAPKDGAK